MKFLRNLLLLIPFFLMSCGLFAQNTTVSGSVSEEGSGEALYGIVAYIDSTSTGAKGAVSDFDGKYAIQNVPTGIYHIRFSGLNYKTQLIEGVEVKQGQKTIVINIVMQKSAILDSEIVIRDVRSTNSAAAIADEMHSNDGVTSGIGGATISKGRDPDAAAVMARIPSVTIIENRFIMVRGLSDRYNNVWLNDAGAPSAETDKRAFSFDMIPAGMLDRIMVYKTPSAELPGDFAGGMVKIYTKAFPDQPTLSLSYQGSYRAGTTGKPFFYTQGSSTDVWGFDNGFRKIPDGTPEYISRNDVNYPTIAKSFQNDWNIMSKNAMPDMRFSFLYAQPIKLDKVLMGNTFSLGYAHTFTSCSIRRQDWDSTAQSADYSDQQSNDQVRVSGVENFSLLYKNLKLEYKNLFNQIGRSTTLQRESNLLSGPNERSYMFGYESRTIYSTQLKGELKSKKENSVYSFCGGFAYTERNAPDLRRIKYTKQRTDPDSLYKAQIANSVDPVNGGGRVYQFLREQTWSFSQNFKQKIHLFDTTLEIDAGTYLELKDRMFIARIIGYTINPGFTAFTLTHYPVGTIFSPENVGAASTFRVDEITSPSDKYFAQNSLYAGYVMAKIPIGQHLNVVTGVRYEYNEQALQGYVNLDSISPSVVTRFWLPSVNATYNFNKKALVRAAWGKTVNRPEFREWSPFYFYDFELRAGTYGSLFPSVIAEQGQILRVAQVDNYDLRFELYPGTADYMHVGIFYKSFIDPIQQVILNSGGSDSRAFTFTNADYAFVIGSELDLRKNLACLDSALHTSAFGNFNVVANLSLMKSRLYLDPETVINQAGATPLQGQSPYVVNGGLYYQNDSIGLSASVLYNVFGPRLILVGTLDYANIGELSRNSLDILISKKIIKCLSVSFGIQDILNQPIMMVQDTNRNGKFERAAEDQEILNYTKGRYFTLGITFSPGLNKEK